MKAQLSRNLFGDLETEVVGGIKAEFVALGVVISAMIGENRIADPSSWQIMSEKAKLASKRTPSQCDPICTTV